MLLLLLLENVRDEKKRETQLLLNEMAYQRHTLNRVAVRTRCCSGCLSHVVLKKKNDNMVCKKKCERASLP